uniref:Sin1 middle CRIM domain-containing protein n=1 Tax=Romanomermis culicivorax TaxID=13658 RepID=A0A915J398_ROMCU
MANWDNKKLLLNYLRHSFIIGDDTGVCELVLKRPDVVERPGWINKNLKEQQSSKVENNLNNDHFSDEDDEFSAYNDVVAHSLDIKIGEVGSHGDILRNIYPTYMSRQVRDIRMLNLGKRTKSEVSKRLESLRQLRRNRSKISIVTCKNAKKITMAVSETNERTDFGFDVFSNRKVDNLSKPKCSLVSQIIDFSRNSAVNPFQQYSEYDAQGTIGGKQLKIFLHSHSESDIVRLPICISTDARVRDLIGLTCFHYTKNGYKPDLRPDVRYYDLRVAEDDGQVDSALPPRSPAENVSRFLFPTMALVEKNLASALAKF